MENRVNVLGVEFDNVTMDEAVQTCDDMLSFSTKSHMICTPNPEIVMRAKDDPEYLSIINSASLVIPDGIGIIKGAEILDNPLKERVAGYDLICNLLEKYSDGSKSFFFWGSKPGIAELAEKKMLEKYPNINILGSEDGYFDDEKKTKIIERLKVLKPDILLVGIGFPKQERLIHDLLDENIFKIAIGCGGSLDVLSGTVKRAPKLFIKAHAEWAWRLIRQPSRIGRMMVLPKFLREVKKDAKKKHVYKPRHILGIEKKLIDFATKHLIILIIIALSLLAIKMRSHVIEHESWDYHQFLIPWSAEIKEKGGFDILGNYPGDYTPPYMVILAILSYIPVNCVISIKVVSIIFDFVLAIACGKLVSHLVKENKKFWFTLTYGIVLFLPLVFLNSSVWGQCDNMYTAFVVLSLLYMLKNKYFRAFVFLGVAYSLKLQFIFILPLYLIMYFIKKDFSILYFLLLPLTLIVLSIPSIIKGMPVEKILKVYANQANEFTSYTTLNFPSIYALIESKNELHSHEGVQDGELTPAGVTLAVSICGILFFYCVYRKIVLTDEMILNLGLLSIMLTTYFLPCMHERYLFMGEILSVLIFIIYRKNLFVPFTLQVMSFITYCNYLFGGIIDKQLSILAIVYAILIAVYAKKLSEIATYEVIDTK